MYVFIFAPMLSIYMPILVCSMHLCSHKGHVQHVEHAIRSDQAFCGTCIGTHHLHESKLAGDGVFSHSHASQKQTTRIDSRSRSAHTFVLHTWCSLPLWYEFRASP